MTNEMPKSAPNETKASLDRKARLKAALKGNMAKRKAQTRARAAESTPPKPEQN